MKKDLKSAGKFIVLAILVFSVTTILFAGETVSGMEQDSFSVKDGMYLEFFGVQNRVNGDFDDTLYFTSPSGVVYDVPEVDPGTGFGLALGGRFIDKNLKGAFEVSYQRSTHDTQSTFVDIDEQTGYFNAIDLNLKIDVFAKDEFRPYVLLGLGVPWLTITDSKVDAYGKYEDETFTGISGNLGIGLAYYIDPQVCITGGYMYRWTSFNEIEGKDIDDNVSGSGPSFRLGLAFTF